MAVASALVLVVPVCALTSLRTRRLARYTCGTEYRLCSLPMHSRTGSIPIVRVVVLLLRLLLLAIMSSSVLYMVSVAVKWAVILVGLSDADRWFRVVLLLTRVLMVVTALWIRVVILAL